MIKVNLLPSEAAEKEAKKRIVILAGFVGAGIVVVALVIFFLRLTYERGLAAKLSSLRQEEKRYREVLDEVNKLKATTSELQAKKDIIDGLMKYRLIYPQFMEALLKLLPSSVWLTNLTTSSDESGFIVTISCIAFDNFAIADFISNLEISKKFTNIELKDIVTTTLGKYESFSFQINLKYIMAGTS